LKNCGLNNGFEWTGENGGKILLRNSVLFYRCFDWWIYYDSQSYSFYYFHNFEDDCRYVAIQYLYGKGKNGNDGRRNSKEYFSKISPKKWELWTIIRSFKSICTREINRLNNWFFAWQSNYYDRIIRNENELQRIQKYIIENPLKWKFDKNNTENLFI
jgi:hypothetical protein